MCIRDSDSGCYTMGYGMAVIEAAKKIRRGLTVKEIVSSIEDWVKHCLLYTSRCV